MIYVYRDRKNQKTCFRPADPEGEEVLRQMVKEIKQYGLEALDIETEMPDEEYREYEKQRQRYGYGQKEEKQRQSQFGFQPQSYMPQPPDFNPQMHYPLWPFVLPFILEGQGGGGSGGGSGGGGSGGGSSNYRSGGEYDGRGGRNENPRDTGRGDSPNR